MNESERLYRHKQINKDDNKSDLIKSDNDFSFRILQFLNHHDIDEDCMVDAYYYNCSSIPEDIQERLLLYNDYYFIYGITNKGEMITKWVYRWDLDSNDPIENGKVVRSEKKYDGDVVLENFIGVNDYKLINIQTEFT